MASCLPLSVALVSPKSTRTGDSSLTVCEECYFIHVLLFAGLPRSLEAVPSYSKSTQSPFSVTLPLQSQTVIQGPVGEKLDNVIHRLNRHPADKWFIQWIALSIHSTIGPWIIKWDSKNSHALLQRCEIIIHYCFYYRLKLDQLFALTDPFHLLFVLFIVITAVIRVITHM